MANRNPTSFLWISCAFAFVTLSTQATPANKAALGRHYDTFLSQNLRQCSTCHLPSKLETPPESLSEFPHNPFGHRLRLLGEQLKQENKSTTLSTRLVLVARQDSDGDGIDNETELLLGHNPGDSEDEPGEQLLVNAKVRRADFARYLSSYRWQPFEAVQRPAVPTLATNAGWIRNPVDHFVAQHHQRLGLSPRPKAAKTTLLRRGYLDLIGLSPTPKEVEAFEADPSPHAFAMVVDRLLSDPRYGERWGRHWMDVWRYSDWAGWSGGNQIRDSKPHIWRWRDWIVESLNEDKGYDQMVREMLAADELTPNDTNSLRATGFLVRNYKMLSREQWMEDTVKHTAQAFLGLTVGCAKCHDHMTDPISQREYYQMRAIFEPHEVRTDRLPGQLDTAQDGLVRIYDAKLDIPTRLFHRGDERQPDTNHVIAPGVPAALGGTFQVNSVRLPFYAAYPDRQEFVIRDLIAASEKKLKAAQRRSEEAKDEAAQAVTKAEWKAVQARHEALLATLRVESLDQKAPPSVWKDAALVATVRQRYATVAEAQHGLLTAEQAHAAAMRARKAAETNAVANAAEGDKKKSAQLAADVKAKEKKLNEARTALTKAQEQTSAEPTTAFLARESNIYPTNSTGRRLAFAQWLTERRNPLTARVAVNHIWLRHFGRALMPNVADFGSNTRPPSHPELLDWLATELMDNGWSMKAIHRLILTSATYQLAATPDDRNAALDGDNIYLWRMNSRRMEAELVRDNLLHVGGQLNAQMGGPEIDHNQGLESKRRSLYLRLAAEKEVEFLKIFDGPSVDECYERKQTVMPQQALALANSSLASAQARRLAQTFLPASPTDKPSVSESEFLQQSFLRVLARPPKSEEVALCVEFLQTRPGGDQAQRWTDLVLMLFNHHDFVTIR